MKLVSRPHNIFRMIVGFVFGEVGMHEQREFCLEGMRLKGHHLPFLQPYILPPRHSAWYVMRDSLACDKTIMPLCPSTKHLPHRAEIQAPLIFSVRDLLEQARRLWLSRWQHAVSPHSCEGTDAPSGLLCAPMIEGLRTRLKSSVWGTYKSFRLLRSDRVTCGRKKGKEVFAFHIATRACEARQQ